jgi:hypothetical protein
MSLGANRILAQLSYTSVFFKHLRGIYIRGKGGGWDVGNLEMCVRNSSDALFEVLTRVILKMRVHGTVAVCRC